MNLQSIGENLKKYRMQKHITQDALAEKAGLSKNYISQIELGNKNPSVESLIKIINAIGVSADLILSELVDESYSAKVSVLYDKIKELPVENQKFICNIVDAMFFEFKNK